MAKIIVTDNFGRDYNGGRSETVYLEGLTDDDAKKIADALNAKNGESSVDYYQVARNDYELYIFTGY
jgi:hypothetical protein